MQDSFFDKFHDMPFLDGAHAAQVSDANPRGFIE
jgi:hypothetical protein